MAPKEAFLAERSSSSEDGERKTQRSVDPKAEQALLRQIDLRLVPILILLYLMSFLDRINISNAITLGLQQHLHLKGNQINVALAIFYVPYVLFEIPSNFLLRKFKPHVWLSICMVLFGLITLTHGFVSSYPGLLAARFFLGLAESGVFPGCSYLLTMWYKPGESLRRFGIFFNSVTLAGAFGSLLATAIDLMQGIQGKQGWQWIFILEGLLTMVVGCAAFFIVPDFPENAKWLDESGRALAVERLREDEVIDGGERSVGQGMKKYFADYKSYLMALLYFGGNITGYSISYFLPTIVKTFHYSSIQTQLHAVPPFAVAWFWSISLCFLSAYFGHRLVFILFSFAVSLAGAIILLTVHTNNHVLYAATFLVTMGLFGGLPVAIIWYVMNLQGYVQRALGTGWMIGIGNLGGIVATFAFQAKDSPRYHLGYSLITFGIVLAAACAILYGVGCYIERRRGGGSRKIVF